MPRLLLKNNAGQFTEIVLKPGSNVFGRAEDNDHRISDSSISGRHCEVIVSEGAALLRDLGSTNGTFVDSAPIQETELQHGQSVRLGSVEMLYQDRATVSGAAGSGAGRIRITVREPARAAEQGGGTSAPPPVLEAPRASDGNECSFHPGSSAAFVCQKCGEPLCPRCVKTLQAGTQALHSCTHCDGLCLRVGDHRKQRARSRRTFFNSFPGAFVYPLKQNGLMMLFCGMIFFGLLDAAADFLIGPIRWFLVVVSVGYLFSFMESIVTSSGMGEDEMPGWPEFSNYTDDIVFPFFRFTAVWVICLLPGVLTMIFGSLQAGIVVLAGGLFCLPMTLLAVAMAGNISGLNPFIIFPGIAKAPLEYLLVCGLLAAILGVQAVLNFGLEMVSIPILSTAAATFIGLYGTFVIMRLLGLLYVTKKEKFNWF